MRMVKDVKARLNIVHVQQIVNADVYHTHFLIILVFVVSLLRVVLNLLHVNHQMMLVHSNMSVFVIQDVIHVRFVIQCQ
jgi:hypothetical protein